MRIIVAGSRDVTEYDTVRFAFIHSGFWKEFGMRIEVVSGTARGVDRLGEMFAANNGLKCHKMPADWNSLGKAAGHIRNKQMGDFAKEGDGRLLAIWDGKSKGTEQMIAYANKIGLKGFVYRTDKPLRYIKSAVGMAVETPYTGKMTQHIITARSTEMQSQSGVMFQVQPPVPKSTGEWMDADWFFLPENESK